MRVARTARWFLPWICVLIVSAAIAHATADALEQNLLEPPEHVVLAGPEPSTLTTPNTSTTPSGSHWVELHSHNAKGRAVSMTCMVADDRLGADTLVLRFDEFDVIAANLCTQLWRTDS